MWYNHRLMGMQELGDSLNRFVTMVDPVQGAAPERTRQQIREEGLRLLTRIAVTSFTREIYLIANKPDLIPELRVLLVREICVEFIQRMRGFEEFRGISGFELNEDEAFLEDGSVVRKNELTPRTRLLTLNRIRDIMGGGNPQPQTRPSLA